MEAPSPGGQEEQGLRAAFSSNPTVVAAHDGSQSIISKLRVKGFPLSLRRVGYAEDPWLADGELVPLFCLFGWSPAVAHGDGKLARRFFYDLVPMHNTLGYAKVHTASTYADDYA